MNAHTLKSIATVASILSIAGLLYQKELYAYESFRFPTRELDTLRASITSNADSLQLKANAMYNAHNYATADTLFKAYLSFLLTTRGVIIDNIGKLEDKTDLSDYLYNYAFNSFFLGDEENGMRLLSLSKECGNIKAFKAYQYLLECPTVNSDVKLSKKIIYRMEDDICMYDIKFDNSQFSTNFWDNLASTNPMYLEFKRESNKNKRRGTFSQARYEIGANEKDMNIRLHKCSPLTKGSLERSIEPYLINHERNIRDLRVYPEKNPNAFATPYGDIYMTSALVNRCLNSQQLLLGICAHEMTHYLCQHSLVELWQTYKKERSNQIWGGIAAGLYVAGMSAAAVATSYRGSSYSDSFYNNIGRTGTQLFEAIADASHYYKFKYSRSQEIEADITAYRFCEAIGIGGYSYIMALQLIFDDGVVTMKTRKSDTHPTLTYRIELLKHLFNKEHNRK